MATTKYVSWLDKLPKPSTESYQIEPGNANARTPMDSGAAKQRRLHRNPPDKFSMVWDMSQQQYELFEGFVQYGLNSGAEWFIMRHWVGVGFVYGTFRFSESPQYNVQNVGPTDFKVSATLERRDKKLISKAAYDVLAENSDFGIISDRLHKYINNTLVTTGRW